MQRIACRCLQILSGSDFGVKFRIDTNAINAAYGTAIIRVGYWLSIMIRSPQLDVCGRVARLYAK